MFKTKLTPEAHTYIATQLAMDIKHKDIQNDVKTKFGIEISIPRIGQIQMSKRGGEVYAVARESYLKTIQKDAAKYIHSKAKRQVILERLLEEILETPNEELGNKFSSGLKEKTQLALKILQQAEKEDKVQIPLGGVQKGSLLQFVEQQTINVENKKEQVIDTIAEEVKGEVIDENKRTDI
jgi:hypothetical protein